MTTTPARVAPVRAGSPVPVPRRGRARWQRRSRDLTGMAMSVPAFALVVLLLGVPIGQAVYYSMTEWDGLTSHWIGPSTYRREFDNPAFWRVLENNALLLAAVPVAMLVSLAIAYVLNQHIPGWRVFRTLLFMPTAISWVVIGMVASRVFAQQGSLNELLRALGLGFLQTDLLAGERSALLAIVLAFVWSMVGTNMIIFLTGFATLDPSLVEAARMDGASSWVIFYRITIPQLKRFMQFSFMITTISAFTALFSLIYVMTGGGPGYGTTTLEFFVYQTAFSKGDFGLGAMLGVILFVIMAAIGLIQQKILRTSD